MYAPYSLRTNTLFILSMFRLFSKELLLIYLFSYYISITSFFVIFNIIFKSGKVCCWLTNLRSCLLVPRPWSNHQTNLITINNLVAPISLVVKE